MLGCMLGGELWESRSLDIKEGTAGLEVESISGNNPGSFLLCTPDSFLLKISAVSCSGAQSYLAGLITRYVM